MSRFTKIVLGLVVVCIAVVVSLGVMLKSSDFSRVKVQLDRMVERATGREFVIAGDLQFNLSLTPSLSISDVHLANAEWGTNADLMILDHLEAQVDLMSLFKGQLNIDYVLIDGLDLYLETDGKGLTNWEFDVAQVSNHPSVDTSSAFKLNPSVRDVRLKNIRVVYKDGATGMTFEGDLKSADFTSKSFDAPLLGGLVAEVNGVSIAAEASLGSLSHVLSAKPDPFPINLTIAGQDLSADVVAMVQHPGKGLDIEARVNLQVFDAQVLGTMFAVENVPDVGQVNVRSKVHMKGQTVTLNGLDVETKDSNASGFASIDMAGQRLDVEARLRSDKLDLSPLVPKDESVAAESDKVFSDAPIVLDGLDALNADVEFEGKEVKLHDLSASDVRTQVKLKDGAVEIKPSSLIFDKGRIDYTALLKPSATGMDINAQASVRNFNAGTVTKLSGQGDLVDLNMDGEVLLITTGNSLHEFAKSANGHVKMIGRHGRINDQKIVGLTESVSSILPWVSNKDANAISCVLAEVPIADGVATAKTVVVDTSGVKIKVTGNVDLGKEQLKLNVDADAKSTSLASFAVPFQVQGTLKKPEVKVSTGGAVVGTLGNIVKTPAKAIAGLLAGTITLVESDEKKKERKEKNDPCVQALKEGNTAPQGTPPEETAKQ